MTVLVATEGGVFALEEQGGSRPELEGPVSALSGDERGVWAVVDRQAVAARGADGTWARLDVDTGARITALRADGDAAWVGTADARLWRVSGDGATPLPAFDDVEGRPAWHAVGSAVPYVRSVSTSADGAVVFASVRVGGIPRSTDGGRSWAPTVDVDDDVHEVRAHPDDPARVMAAAAVGLLESDDGGERWRRSTDGLHATYLRSVAFPTGAVVVGASDGPFGRRAALYRRDLAGGRFVRCDGGLPEWLPGLVDTGSLDAAGDQVVAAAGTALVGSRDGGRSWAVLVEDLPRVAGVVIVRPG